MIGPRHSPARSWPRAITPGESSRGYRKNPSRLEPRSTLKMISASSGSLDKTVSSTDVSSAARRHSRLPAWMREPLLHFVVFGGFLFGVGQHIAGPTDRPHTVTGEGNLGLPAREAFKQEHG